MSSPSQYSASTATPEADPLTGRRTGADPAMTPWRANNELVTARGRTSIADTVVRKIAGVAAREVSGVYALGTGGARAVGSIRDRMPGTPRMSVAQGVSVEVGERQAAIDLDLVVEYGVSILDLSHAVRRNVIAAVEQMTGLDVTEVNIAVDDVHLPEDGTDNRSGRVE
ncbi:MAG: Asp23/Gls24 family envelope stress response protein [Frankia sp.]